MRFRGFSVAGKVHSCQIVAAFYREVSARSRGQLFLHSVRYLVNGQGNLSTSLLHQA